MTMSVPFSGGCACGAIRYECSAAPIESSNCNCRDCQRASGSAFGSFLVVGANAFQIRSGPNFYRKIADSGNPKLLFGLWLAAHSSGASSIEARDHPRGELGRSEAPQADDGHLHGKRSALDLMNSELEKFPACPHTPSRWGAEVGCLVKDSSRQLSQFRPCETKKEGRCPSLFRKACLPGATD
jgi:Glutathione-dependent formaldehyde-activating enzyme